MTKFEFINFKSDFNNCSKFFIKPEVVIFLDRETNYILDNIKKEEEISKKKLT